MQCKLMTMVVSDIRLRQSMRIYLKEQSCQVPIRLETTEPWAFLNLNK